jgi:hypothetical protein
VGGPRAAVNQKLTRCAVRLVTDRRRGAWRAVMRERKKPGDFIGTFLTKFGYEAHICAARSER